MIGLSVRDFEGMDADEFSALCDVFNEHCESLRRDGWERARIVGTLAVSPYVKGGARPQRILPLPWDGNAAAKSRHTEPLSREEDKRRLENLMSAIKGKGTTKASKAN